MKRFIKVEFPSDTREEFELVVDGLLTSIDRDPIVVDTEGAPELYIEVMNDKEMLEEVFTLGIAWQSIHQQYGIKTPFVPSVVEMEEAPQGVDLNQYDD